MAKSYTLRKNPTEQITIDGEEYEVELGNPSFIFAADEWRRALTGISEKLGEDDQMKALREAARSGREIVASAMGEQAADRLVGGPNALNVYRIIDVIRILVDVVGSDESIEAMRAAAGSTDTRSTRTSLAQGDPSPGAPSTVEVGGAPVHVRRFRAGCSPRRSTGGTAEGHRADLWCLYAKGRVAPRESLTLQPAEALSAGLAWHDAAWDLVG